MSILSNFTLGNAGKDGVYIDAILVPPTASGPATGLVAVVGGANDGPVGVPVPFSDSSSLFSLFGNDTVSTYSLVRGSLNAMPECSQFLGVRATDGTDTAAVIDLPNGGVFATGTLTVSGSPATGTLSATLVNGATTVTTTPVNVTNVDTVTTAAVKLATAIGASAACVGSSAFLQVPAIPTSGAIALASIKFGTSSNSITYAGTAVGSGFTLTPSTATALSGGTAAGNVNVVILTRKNTGSNGNNSTAQFVLQSGSPNNQPVYSLQITNPGNQPEFYNGLVAYTGTVYAAATLQANALAAVNGTVKGQSGSPNWVATAGSATNPPTQNLQAASGGTDGTSGLNSALLIGNSGNVGRTGMNALSGQVAAGQVFISGLTDPTVGQTLIAFRQTEDCLIHLSFPEGTTTAQAVATRTQYDLADPGLVLSIFWDLVFDQTSQTSFYTAPMGKIAGIISSVPTYLYVGNQPVTGAAGVSGTERIGGTQSPVNSAEATQLQQNGILYLGYMPRAPRGPQLGLPHGIASDGVTRISDYRMLAFIVVMLQQIEGAFVGGPMKAIAGAQLGQPTFGSLQDAVNGFFSSLVNGQPAQLAAASFTLGSINTPTTIAEGYLIPTVLVQTLSACQFLINLLNVGPGVQTQVQVTAA